MSTLEFFELGAGFKILEADRAALLLRPALKPHFRSNTVDLCLGETSVHIASGALLKLQ